VIVCAVTRGCAVKRALDVDQARQWVCAVLTDGKDVSGTLYGTTVLGGAYGYGTVFSITTGGTEKVVHSFGYGSDGTYPAAGLINVGGTLYGTTQGGGKYGLGTVFSIPTGGTEKVLYSFRGKPDGHQPLAARLIAVGSTLYGTTYYGGAYDAGTVFSITTSGGADKVLHSFGKATDGSSPEAGLIRDVSGTLYGTTAGGGAYKAGAVFSITTGGVEKILHSFSGTDGSYPFAALIDVARTLYGTTYYGGANKAGTVFSITTSGTERVLHSFGGGTDGTLPDADLINVGGTLYGTTSGDGMYGRGGTVFSIPTVGGTEKVLHNFRYFYGGTGPAAGLIDVGGVLYGTTQNGGAAYEGTVFSLTP
jgi:uncharacterized repeat protein (TIGR03803 family)